MKAFLKLYAKIFLFLSPLYILLMVSLLVRVDAYIYVPGNTDDVSKEVKIEGYENNKINGQISSIYVLEVTRPSLFMVGFASLFKSSSIVWVTKEEMSQYDKELDYAVGTFDSKQSFNNAALAAYEALNKDIDYLQVTYISLAKKDIVSNLKYSEIVGCRVKECGGIENPKLSEVSAYLAERDSATLTLIDRKNNEKELTISRREDGLYGITLQTSFILSDSSLISISNVYTSGPSGGAMEALYVYCLLNDIDIVKGRNISGTGTISYKLDNEGNLETFGKVGAIGCVGQKLYAAYLDKVEVFYCPDSNYQECMKYYALYGFKESDIRVVKVSYLSDIINDLMGE